MSSELKEQEEKEVVLEEVTPDWDLKALSHPRSKYTAEQKISLVTSYVLTGSLKKSAANSGVDYERSRSMKTRSVWWDDAIKKVRKQKQDELDSVMTDIIDASMSQVKDRVTNGDVVRDARSGENHRVPMKGKDIAVTAAVLFDKRSLIRGDATSISSKRQDPLKDIEEKLKKFAEMSKIKPVK